MGSLSESIVLDSLYKYGEKAFIVLKTAYEVYQNNSISGKKLLGDFDFKSIIIKLREKGFNYNPNQLLRILERDFGIIETTYRSSNQRWWRFIDPIVVSKALNTYEGKENNLTGDDPEITLLRFQVDIVDLDGLLKLISEFASKEFLTQSERKRIKQLFFEDIPLVVKLFKETQVLDEEFREFNSKVRLMFKYLSILVKKLKGVNIDINDLNIEEVETINKPSVKIGEID
ncbi:MAG: hypothetical protein QXZ10_02050 [Sulfolobales archaeon]